MWELSAARYLSFMSFGRGILVLIFAGALLLMADCACKRCDQERESMRLEWGDPQERSVERTGHLLTETWFYWDEQRSVVFLWDDRDCSCDVSTYRFEGDGLAQDLGFRTHSSYPLGP